MKHIINGREWRLVSRRVIEGVKWNSNYLCPDGDYAVLYTFENSLELECFSGMNASSINIDVIDFSYLAVKLDHRDPFEVQCLHIADYFCRLFCTWKEN